MSPPERFAPDDPREWMNRARSNLALAKNRVPGAYLEDLCFEAQQAAAKAVKAVLISRDIEYPYVHDLARLLSMLEDAGESAPCVVRKAEELTPYALITRYTGPARAVTTPEYLAAWRPLKPSSDGPRGAYNPSSSRAPHLRVGFYSRYPDSSGRIAYLQPRHLVP